MYKHPAIFADSAAVAQPEAMARRVSAAESRPRVLLVARWPVGGIRTHLLSNYSALSEAGFRFTFVGPANDSLDSLRAGFGDIEGAGFIGVPVENRRCRLWPVVRGLLREGRFGLLHSHGVTAAAHAALANLGVGVPHIATLHEPLRPTQFPGWLGRLKRWTLARALAQADTILTVSDDAQANLLEHFPALCSRTDRLLTVPNGIHAQHYAAPEGYVTETLRERLGLDAQPFLMGFLGRFMPEKGFPILLEAVERLARQETVRPFHLVAFGSSDYRREYQNTILRRGLEKFISLLDFVADVQPVLRQLDLVVVPSLWEASSLVSMEAMAAGVPVLGSDCIGLREVLRGTPSRIVTANDPAALTAGLRAALDEPWTRAARDFAPKAQARFDNGHSVRRLTALFDSLAARPRATLQAA
ncbi:MAG TPA: glycosyltransferase family 4 protein [Gemmataceae bacterium]|nr:glycosyltransferase family 4 protein [Gemmataceae bacterium]